MLWVPSRSVRSRSKPPSFVRPCQPGLDGNSAGPGWLYEINSVIALPRGIFFVRGSLARRSFCGAPMLWKTQQAAYVLLSAYKEMRQTFNSVNHHGRWCRHLSSACWIDLEGIVSKRIRSRYVSSRTRAWLKVKDRALARHLRVELPIVEATTPEELDIAFASAAAQRADAMVILGDTLTVLQAPGLSRSRRNTICPRFISYDNSPMGDWSSMAPM